MLCSNFHLVEGFFMVNWKRSTGKIFQRLLGRQTHLGLKDGWGRGRGRSIVRKFRRPSEARVGWKRERSKRWMVAEGGSTEHRRISHECVIALVTAFDCCSARNSQQSRTGNGGFVKLNRSAARCRVVLVCFSLEPHRSHFSIFKRFSMFSPAKYRRY